MNITKFSPNNLDFLRRVAVHNELERFDKIRLVSSRNANRVAERVANDVIEVLDDRDHFR